MHLDGSLRPATMLELAKASGVALPATEAAALADWMRVDDARDLRGYLDRFELTIPLLQTEEAIERVAFEMVEDAAADGVRHLEVRNCPELNTRQGLSLSQVIAAELHGLARGTAAFGVGTGLINCSLRHFDPAVSVRIAEASARFAGAGVVGFDLAGGEAGHPPEPHAAAFTIAREAYLGVTVHAGEAAGPASIRGAVLACGADRIGHGTTLAQDQALQDYLRDRRTVIECNLTSNVQTHAVPRASAHPARRYLEAGLVVTLCTDNWLMSGTSLSEEYWRAQEALGLDRAAIDRLILNGFEGAFLPWPARERLLAEVRAELARVH